jgi:hypothetical protein
MTQSNKQPQIPARAMQFSLLPPFIKGGWGDFGMLPQANPPSPPFAKGGNGTKAPQTE